VPQIIRYSKWPCLAISVAVLLLLRAEASLAQDDTLRHAIVVRNVNLRLQPNSAQPPIRLLRPPDEVELREDSLTNGYYAVRTEDDEDGWVWGKNVQIDTAETTGPGLMPAGSAGAGVADHIDESWEKPAPNHSTFSSQGKTCGATGDGGDRETNLRKNRTDTPPPYHNVTFAAIAQLPYPHGPKHRHDWSQSQLAEIERFEGVAVQVVGYLAALKPQTGGSGESTNCHWTGAAQVDWHLALVGTLGQGESESVVIETTPRIRRKHSAWTTGTIGPWVDQDTLVRISGWLMFDPEHRNHLNKYRATLWEIHPITKIEVWRDGSWVDLDD